MTVLFAQTVIVVIEARKVRMTLFFCLRPLPVVLEKLVAISKIGNTMQASKKTRSYAKWGSKFGNNCSNINNSNSNNNTNNKLQQRQLYHNQKLLWQQQDQYQ